mgnify:CR=1 FL=1
MQVHHAKALSPRCSKHGEGACWWDAKQVVIWVDILAREVHLYDPKSGTDRMWTTPTDVGYAQPMQDGGLVLGLRDGIARLDLNTSKITMLAEPEADDDTTRMNDGKPGPDGRFYGGSMAYGGKEPLGSLWKFNKDFSFEHAIDHVTISNGLCWSGDGSTFYYIDSPTQQVVAYDFDMETGNLSRKRVAVEVPKENGVPDGMTIDADDNLWVAHWNGYSVGCYSPKTGKLLEKIALPCPKVTCVSFGGPDHSLLYITTSRVGEAKMTPEEAKASGYLYVSEPGVQGLPGNVYGA